MRLPKPEKICVIHKILFVIRAREQSVKRQYRFHQDTLNGNFVQGMAKWLGCKKLNPEVLSSHLQCRLLAVPL